MHCKVFCESASVVQDITGVPSEGYNPFFFGEDGDVLPFRFTQESFLRVLSALQIGAQIAYGDEGRQVVWDFLVNVEYPMPLCDQIAQAILTCEDVQAALATVIATVPVVQDAIRDFVTEDPEINQHISDVAMHITEGLIAGKIIEGSCDKSVVAGKVIAIVERMDDINVDFLEIIEVGTNDEEKVSTLLSAIPGLSESPVDEIVDFYQDLLEDFTENYNGAITEDWKNEVEEDLYCLAREQEDCSLSYQQLFDYFQERVGSNLSVQSVIQNVLDWVINGDFSTDDLIASGMYAMQLAFILAGQEFAGMNVPKIGSLTRDALPSTKWEDWDECGPPPPSDLWTITTCIGETRYGIIDKISGPESGPGTYEFKFTGVQYDPPTSIFIGGFRWGNSAEKFVVNSVSANITFDGSTGTPYTFPPGSEADCGYEPDLTVGLPIANSTTAYGGIKANTYAAYPWEITMNITVSAI